MSTLTARRSADQPGAGIGARLDSAWLVVWRLFTSVNFAVLQIIVLALLAVVGMTIRQLPGFAFRSAGDYAAAMADIHARYDAVLGAGIVDAMERLQLFHVFSSTWFTIGLVVLILSIVICTIDRTPRLWRMASEIRVVQPDAYFDPRGPLSKEWRDGDSVWSLVAEDRLDRALSRIRTLDERGELEAYVTRNDAPRAHIGQVTVVFASRA